MSLFAVVDAWHYSLLVLTIGKIAMLRITLKYELWLRLEPTKQIMMMKFCKWKPTQVNCGLKTETKSPFRKESGEKKHNNRKYRE